MPSIPSRSMERFSKGLRPMGWDGTESFEDHPIPWDENASHLFGQNK